MLNENVRNGKFRRPSRITDSIQQNSVSEMSLCGTPSRQVLALRIVKDTHFTGMNSKKLFATVEFALLRCGRNELHAG